MSQSLVAMRSHRLCVVAILAAALAIAGCGSSSTNSSGGSIGKTTNTAGVKEATQWVNAHKSAPTSIGTFPVLPKTPPKGLTVAFLDCGVAGCTNNANGIRAASKLLGWKFDDVVSGETPEGIANAWNQIVTTKPTVVLAAGLTDKLFPHQLAAYKKEGGIYVALSTPDKPGPTGPNAVVLGPPNYASNAEATAKLAISQHGTSTNTLSFYTTDIPIQLVEHTAFVAAYKKLCPTCKLTSVPTLTTDVGSSLPNQVVTSVQRNPGTNVVAMGFGDMTEGVPEALSAASLSDVSVVAPFADSGNLQHVKSGTSESETIAEPDFVSTWGAMYVATRLVEGLAVPASISTDLLLPLQVITKQNVQPDVNATYIGDQNYVAQFKRLWKLP